MDDITKHKIANTLKGRKHSATTNKRISQALKGRKLSDKHKRHISEAMKRKTCITRLLTSSPIMHIHSI